MVPSVTPQLVANNGLRALRLAITDPERFACERKVDGVGGLVVYQPDGTIETRNRRGERRDWLRGDAFEGGMRRASRIDSRSSGTERPSTVSWSPVGSPARWLPCMAPSATATSSGLLSLTSRCSPGSISVRCPGRTAGERLELLAQAFDLPLELSPLVEPSRGLVEAMENERLEGIVLKDRTAPYREGSRVGWSNVKDAGWYERES
jgi:hypothetical protein